MTRTLVLSGWAAGPEAWNLCTVHHDWLFSYAEQMDGLPERVMADFDDVLAEAARKCREKGLSFIVANDVSEKGCGFGTDTNRVTFVFPDGTQWCFPLMTKRKVARRILDEVARL